MVRAIVLLGRGALGLDLERGSDHGSHRGFLPPGRAQSRRTRHGEQVRLAAAGQGDGAHAARSGVRDGRASSEDGECGGAE